MIIGITGTLGAGKGTVVEYLKTKGFRHFWARAFFVEEIERRGLPVNRDTMTSVANDLRATHGSDYFVRESLATLGNIETNAVIESIRTTGEAQYLKDKGALLWGIDADPRVRYDRVVLRSSGTDKVSFEKFVADEEREMHNTDTAKQNIAGVMKLADHIFYNTTTQADLFAQVEEVLQKTKVK